MSTVFRAEDEALLERLEDEALLERLFLHHAGAVLRGVPGPGVAPPPRASGLLAETRKLPGGREIVHAALSGEIVPLVRFVEAPPMLGKPPAFLHHLALYFGKVASLLAPSAPEAAANAWMRALAAWFALAAEGTYLTGLEEAVLGDAAKRGRSEAFIPPERVPIEIITDVARRAEKAARELLPEGRAALLALSFIDDAARLGGAPEELVRRARIEAERRRNAAIEVALASIGEALDDANVRGQLGTSGRTILVRAVDVWRWTSGDAAVEHFTVDRLGTIGWELYRARRWDALRHLLDPFRPMIDALASRIERDPSQIAYAASCAQMFVFLSEVDPFMPRKLELAERAVRICPSHRNGRLVLASYLCDTASESMRAMVLFARKEEVERVETQLGRAESLYPSLSELPEAKKMLERLKKGRLIF